MDSVEEKIQMNEELSVKKFATGLKELSDNIDSNSGGSKQEQEIELNLTDALEELSRFCDGLNL